MRLSHFFLPTLREVPADAEVVSHVLLLRAGFVRQLASGVYSYLPLAQRSLLKIQEIIRQEMNAIGGQEFHLPAIHPAEIWQATGRWEVMGANMFRFKDRWQRDMCLGMTHEEVFTWIAKNELRSYRELPQIWYQIQSKFRDEPRPKSGLLRVRQFTMKDSYSFDLDKEGLDRSYELHRRAYCRIYSRCGLAFYAVEAHSGSMGGSHSQEFMVRSDAGEDLVAMCPGCGYAANLEKATCQPEVFQDAEPAAAEPARVHTPGQKSIEEVSAFLGVDAKNMIKTLVYTVDSKAVLILMRGDLQLNELKLESALGTSVFRPAFADEIEEALGASAGSLGPVGASRIRILADESLRGRRNLVCGANEDDYHLTGVTPGVHFEAEYHDFRTVAEGDGCPSCGQPVQVAKTIEVGHIFKLGTKYSESLSATVLDAEGQHKPIIMGSYGIGVERILAGAIEQGHDENGMILPATIAPFEVIVTPVSMEDADQARAAEDLYGALRGMGVDVLLDDRNERPGVKFKDADLIGAPVRLTIGPKKLKEGLVELSLRRDGVKHEVALSDAAAQAVARLTELKAELDSRADRY